MSCRYRCITHNDKICCFECEDYKICQTKCTKVLSENLNVDNYKKCKEYIEDKEKQIGCEKDTKETVSNDFTETTYFVKLKDKYVQELCKTKIANRFCGTIVNQTVSNIYFELKDTKELVIIPHEYISWLAPIREKN